MIAWHHLIPLVIGGVIGYLFCCIVAAVADWDDDEELSKWTKGPQ